MPKVEVDSMRVDGLDMVPAFALHRANAEIEKTTTQRDDLVIALLALNYDAALKILQEVGLTVDECGTVTEIDRG